MKVIKKQSRALKLASVLFATSVLAACGTFSGPDSNGNAKSVVWPDAPTAENNFGHKLGTFPNLENLYTIRNGMSRDQLYNLVGVPNYSTSRFQTHEWDYLFHFNTPGRGKDNITTCQFKVLFDSNKLAQNFYWKAVDPVDAQCPPGRGQPEVAAAAPAQTITLASDGLFRFNRSSLNDLNAEGRAKLDRVAQAINSGVSVQSIEVIGYTDRLGTAQYNQRLSQARANTVASYLVSQGVAASKVTAVGRGSSDPVVQCSGSGSKLISCLAPNRRVAVNISGVTQAK